MLSNKNNLRSELTANVWVLDTTISITSWEWVLWENNMVACLEHYESGVCTKREVIKITAKSTDTFTITRWFADCIMNDNTKAQGHGSQTFSVGDYLSLYLSKEIWESLTTWISTNETAIQTMVARINAPRTCINNCCQSWKNAIDTAYYNKYCWNSGFGTGADGDCVITVADLDAQWYKYLCASCEYNFNNLTICPWVKVRFLWSGVPTINVWDKFINCGEIELKSWFVSNTCQTDCWLERWCQICNQCTNWWLFTGGRWWCGGWNGSAGSAGCNGSSSCGGAGWTGWQWCSGCPASWCNGWKWWCWKSSNNCNGGGWWWWGGWWWLYWNGGDWWDGWYNGLSQTCGWEWWKGWNSGCFWKAGNGGANGWAYSWNGWKGGDWWDWYIGWNWYSVWNRTSDVAWVGGKWILCGWIGGGACYYGWSGGDAITNVYWFHLNARNIWNNCVNARWWDGWKGGETDYWQSWNGWNGANGGQMIISYDCMHEEWCFDVRGGCGGEPWHVRRPSCWWTSWSCWCAWSDGWKVFKAVNYPYISNFTLESDGDNEAILISWRDPSIKQSASQQRAKTVVRYSTSNYPTTPTDWTLAVQETTKNQYENTPYSLTGVLDETTYYFTAFAIDQNNNIIDSQTQSITTDFWWHVTPNTLVYYNIDDNDSSSAIYDKSGNNRTLSWWSFTYTNDAHAWKVYVWWNYSTLPSRWIINFGQNFSFVVWVKLTNSTDWYSIFANGAGSSSHASNGFWHVVSPSIIKWMASWVVNDWLCVQSNTSPTLNTWLCLWYSRDSSWNMKIFFNGQNVWTATLSNTVQYPWSTQFVLWWWRAWDKQPMKWYLKILIWEDKKWEDSEFLSYFNKSKSQFWY